MKKERLKERLTELLSISEFADEAGISERLARDFVYKRKIAHVRIGKLLKISRKAFDDFIAERTVPAFDDAEKAREILGGQS